jgi:uncharacterized protein (DUF305 family)
MNCQTLKSVRARCLVPLAAFCLVSAAAQAQSAGATDSSASMPQGHMQQGAAGSEEMKHSMMTGMNSMQKMQMSGDTDKDFARMMKMHHQQALYMAQTELDQGKSPEMKAMAKEILAAQKKEIAQFDQWLAKQK